MNENMNTVVVTQEPEEIELDLRDMFATLFLRWKTLLPASSRAPSFLDCIQCPPPRGR